MLMNNQISFEEMANRYGEIIAYEYLEQIERAAKIQPQRLVSNPEMRLENAIRIQDAINDNQTLN